MASRTSAAPPPEQVNRIVSMVATTHWDRAAWFGQEKHENTSEIVMMHTDIIRASFHAPRKEEKYVAA